MTLPTVRFNDYVSLAIMLLMVIALVAGQSGNTAYASEQALIPPPALIGADRIDFDLHGQLGDTALELSIAVVTDLSHFRGENE